VCALEYRNHISFLCLRKAVFIRLLLIVTQTCRCFLFKFSNNMVLKVGIQFNNKRVEPKKGNIHGRLL